MRRKVKSIAVEMKGDIKDLKVTFPSVHLHIYSQSNRVDFESILGSDKPPNS